jgi:uncharacterized membrane protein YhaH (DUF805 family)
MGLLETGSTNLKWYLAALKKYADFSGRAQRAEYWYFVLFYFIFFILLAIIDQAVGLFNYEITMGLLSGLFGLAMFLPSIAVAVRRLHDTGRSGWWLLISLIPLVGGIVLIVFCCLDSAPGTNAYGPNPKAAA